MYSIDCIVTLNFSIHNSSTLSQLKYFYELAADIVRRSQKKVTQCIYPPNLLYHER